MKPSTPSTMSTLEKAANVLKIADAQVALNEIEDARKLIKRALALIEDERAARAAIVQVSTVPTSSAAR